MYLPETRNKDIDTLFEDTSRSRNDLDLSLVGFNCYTLQRAKVGHRRSVNVHFKRTVYWLTTIGSLRLPTDI